MKVELISWNRILDLAVCNDYPKALALGLQFYKNNDKLMATIPSKEYREKKMLPTLKTMATV